MADSKKKLVFYRRSSAPAVPTSMPAFTWQELGKIEQALNRLYTEIDTRLKAIEVKLGID